ncbi:MAG: hypothetical protein II933_07085 [Candidatus Methanomethylophilaceae archaeon]|nr:hypothetical protein [Thermoplasmata archaeon]MBQ3686089.1 hypothetical protein [Candidatus Methanomethylophilaceae archaeon]
MADANMKKAGTGKSALGLVLVAVGIIAIIAAVVWALMQPGVLEEVVNIAVIAILVIFGIVIIIYAVVALAAIPVYAMKGEQYQEGIDYNMDDVQPVKESSSEDPKNGTS